MKKILCVLFCMILVLSCVSCSKNSGKEIIGIIQFGSHESLNNCYDGIIKGLEENGIDLSKYEIEYVNSNFDASVSLTQANRLVNEKAKVIIAIATPSAVAAANAASGTQIPVVFCAVTDASVMNNYGGVTGSSDIPDFNKQLALIKKVMNKDELSIGVLYSTEESSSPIQINNLNIAAKKAGGINIVSEAVSDITTIDTKVNTLIDAKVDCFLNLLDNTIVGKLESNILPLTNEKKIPVFGSEIEQVKSGCIASASIEYIDVGRKAGESAAKILGGTNASDIPVAFVTEPQNFYNSEVFGLFGMEIPDDIGTDVAVELLDAETATADAK